jgi:tRNA-binding protein
MELEAASAAAKRPKPARGTGCYHPAMADSTTPAEAALVTPALKPQIPFDDFAKLDLRVATVLDAEPHPNADRLLKVRLDDGSPGGRQVCAGIRQWYDPQALIGRQVVIVANLEPRTIRGEVSQGMILAASDVKDAGGEERDVVILTLDRPVKPGSVVS